MGATMPRQQIKRLVDMDFAHRFTCDIAARRMRHAVPPHARRAPLERSKLADKRRMRISVV
jgi:hypothetical protein